MKGILNEFDSLILPGEPSSLEQNLIKEYLRSKGYQLPDLKRLPIDTVQGLMREACIYAALKLAEIESRAKFRKKIEAPARVQ